MDFVTEELEEGEVYPQIEFVTVEELIEIAEKTMIDQTEASLIFHETVKKYLEAKGICEEKRSNDNTTDSSGMLF